MPVGHDERYAGEGAKPLNEEEGDDEEEEGFARVAAFAVASAAAVAPAASSARASASVCAFSTSPDTASGRERINQAPVQG